MITKFVILFWVGAASVWAVDTTSVQTQKFPALTPLTSSPSEVSQILSEIYKVEQEPEVGLEETESLETKEELETVPELFAEETPELEITSSELLPDDLIVEQELFLSVGKSEELETSIESSSTETEDPRDPFINLETSPL